VHRRPFCAGAVPDKPTHVAHADPHGSLGAARDINWVPQGTSIECRKGHQLGAARDINWVLQGTSWVEGRARARKGRGKAWCQKNWNPNNSEHQAQSLMGRTCHAGVMGIFEATQSPARPRQASRNQSIPPAAAAGKEAPPFLTAGCVDPDLTLNYPVPHTALGRASLHLIQPGRAGLHKPKNHGTHSNTHPTPPGGGGLAACVHLCRRPHAHTCSPSSCP